MKTSVKNGCLVAVLFTGFGTFGSFAQERAINMHDLQAARNLLDEWEPAQQGSRTSGFGSPQGTAQVRNYETDMPYLELLKFYAGKCGLSNDDLFADSLFGESGSRGTSSGGALLSVSNRPNVLSATFVRLYPHYTVTVTLCRAKQDKQTAVTVTRIDPSEKGKP